MKLLAVGDSFTFGEELSNTQNAWPYQLGKLIDYDVLNLARPGAGNNKSIRNVIEQVLQYKPDLVVIGWASPGRIEFADEDGFFDTWPGYSGRAFFKEQPWREQLVRYVNEHHSVTLLYRQFLFNVIMLQNFLENNQVKFAMTHTVANEFYYTNGYKGNEDLQDKIKTEYFVDGYNNGMAEWTYGCPQGPAGHFLDSGHKIVAEKFNEHFRNLGWLS